MAKLFFVFFLLLILPTGCLQKGQLQDMLRSEFILHDGLKRTYTLYIPSTYDNKTSNPLLIILHGGGGTGEDMVKLTKGGFNTLAEKEGFIVAYPDGVENHWNDGRGLTQYKAHREKIDDVGFISELIDALDREWNIDNTRVYAAGISNGGMMAQRLACEMTDKIAAIGVVSSAMSENLSSFCTPSRPISVLIVAGMDDPLIPYDGGEVGFGGQEMGTVLSIQETVEFWVSNNECSFASVMVREKDADPRDGTKVRREAYSECKDGTEVSLYVIEGGGHTWPGGLQYLPIRMIGRTSKDIDATIILWNFFKDHVIQRPIGMEGL